MLWPCLFPFTISFSLLRKKNELCPLWCSRAYTKESIVRHEKWISFSWFCHNVDQLNMVSSLFHRNEIHQIWATIVIINASNFVVPLLQYRWSCPKFLVSNKEKNGSIILGLRQKGHFEMARVRAWQGKSDVGIWSASIIFMDIPNTLMVGFG